MTKKATTKGGPSKVATENPREYEAGRRAARSGIDKEQAPVFYSKDAEKAWHEGFDAHNG